MRRTAVFHLVLCAAVAVLSSGGPAAARPRHAAAEDPCAGLSRSDLRACKADQSRRGRSAEADPCGGLSGRDLKACKADAAHGRVREAEADPCGGLAGRDLRSCKADEAHGRVREAEADPCGGLSRADLRACRADQEKKGRSRTEAAAAAPPGRAARREIQPSDLVGGVEATAAAAAPGGAPALRGSLPADVAVPVAGAEPRSRGSRRPAHLHEVTLEDGQSLADLAASTGVSVADLAKLNGISSLEDVPTGMALKLPAGAKAPPVRTASAPPPAASPPAVATAAGGERAPVVASAPSPRTGRRGEASVPSSGPRPYASLGPEGASAPSAASAPAAGRWGRTQADAMAAYQVASARAPHLADRPDATHDRFVWPLRAEVVSAYGDHGTGRRNDGLDLAGRPGDAVRAAAAGEVVYAGKEIAASGGNLVLLKHADGWVTAYSHLGRLTVGMRQTVDQGQEIAETPDVAGASVHFEVRQPGAEGAKPVDPATVLPARGETGRG